MNNKFLTGKQILVTGATGFVGSHLTEALVNLGTKVTATTHHPLNPKSYFATQKLERKCRLVQIELTDFSHNQQLITHNQFDFIFHLAAQPLVELAYDDPKTTLYSNIIGTINILESARLSRNVKGIIVASSDKAYGKMNQVSGIRYQVSGKKTSDLKRGDTREGSHTKMYRRVGYLSGRTPKFKYKESDPLAGDHPYEVSKSAADLVSLSYFKTYGLPVLTTRFGNIYGEGDLHFSRLIPGLMKALVKNETFEVRSNGRFVRDYLYVKDVVKGYMMLAENIDKVEGEAFNFGSDDTYSVISLISLISNITRLKIDYKILNNAKNEIPYQSLDWTKIKKILGWEPEKPLNSTVIGIYDWYKKFLE